MRFCNNWAGQARHVLCLFTAALHVTRAGHPFPSEASEARSTVAGSLGLVSYGWLVSWLLLRRRARTLVAASAALGLRPMGRMAAINETPIAPGQPGELPMPMGVITVATGLIATRLGPVLGGSFLTFPAMLPANLTLLAQHGRNTSPAGADAYGSIFGSAGLLACGAVLWGSGIVAPAWLLLSLATVVWLVTARGTWALADRLRCARRERAGAAAGYAVGSVVR
jgi:hypothetical protein